MRLLSFLLLSLLFGLLVCVRGAEAQTRAPIRLGVGPAQIALVERTSRDTLRFAQAGDTVTVDVLVNGARRQPLTGVQFHLKFDPAFLSPVDAYPDSAGFQPVRSGGLIPGATVIANAFNEADASRYRGILYAEGLLFGSAAADSGRVASVAFRMVRAIPPGGDVTVAVDPDTLVFRSTYQTQTAAGLVFPLSPRNTLHLTALPPSLSLPGPLTVRADSSLVLNLTALASDPLFPTRQLTWAVAAGDSGVSVAVNDAAKTATVVPRRAYSGTTTLSFVVTNPGGFSAKGEVSLQVRPPNRPPVISPAFPQEVRLVNGKAEVVPLILLVNDPDVSIAALRWSFAGQQAVTLTVDARAELTITSSAAWQGQERVTLTVRDPDGATASVTFTVVGTASALAGDFNGDGAVTFDDFFAFAAAFGSARGQAGFDAKYDMDGSGRVDLDDFFVFAGGFGKGR